METLGKTRRAARYALSVILWPILLSACLYLTWRGIETGRAELFLNLTYVGLAILMFALERLLPYEQQWLRNDKQIARSGAYPAQQGLFAIAHRCHHRSRRP